MTGKFAPKAEYQKAVKKLRYKVYSIMALITIGSLVIIGSGKYTEYEIGQLAYASVSIPKVEEKVEPAPAEPVKLPTPKEYAYQKAVEAGLDPIDFLMIMKCESQYNEEAVGFNTNGTFDAGILQINSIHKDISLKDKLDPYKAIDWSIKKRLRDGNWSAWVCARKLNIK